jgi:uncharacterized RDD family membrane protein YckC
MDSTYGTGTQFCAECGRPTPADELARFGDLMICPICKDSYAQKLREGVTPAARQAPRQYAGFWIRFVAVLIDGIILAVVGWVVQFAFLGAMLRPDRLMNPSPEAVGAAMGLFGLAFLINIAIACTYESFFLGRFGATPGKMALSLKVVRSSGAPVSYARAAGRYFAKQLNLMTLLIGYIIAGFDSEKRGLHDMICDTRVIKTGV